MEFKGTKGPWTTRQLFDLPIHVVDEETGHEWDSNSIDVVDANNGRIISEVKYMSDTENQGWGNNNTPELMKANAKLISKAPEMLEMLERCKDYINVSGMDGLDRFELIENIKQLIKEATEL